MTREQFNFNPDISNIKESEEFKKSVAEQKAKEEEGLTRWQRIKAFFKNGRTRFAMGVILMLVGLYLAISFMSFFFFSGASDQNRIDNFGVMENAMAPQEIHNALALRTWCKCLQLLYRQWRGHRRVHFGDLVLRNRLPPRQERCENAFFHPFIACAFQHIRFFVGNRCVHLQSRRLFLSLGRILRQVCQSGVAGACGRVRHDCRQCGNRLDLGVVVLDFNKEVFAKIPKNFNRGAINSHPAVDNQPGPEDVFKGVDKDEAEKPEKPVAKPKPKKPVEKQPEPVGVETEYVNPQEMKTVSKITNPHDPTGEFIHYRFPTLDLLQDIKMKKNNVDIDEQEANNRENYRDV
jgi:hypothetical protein